MVMEEKKYVQCLSDNMTLLGIGKVSYKLVVIRKLMVFQCMKVNLGIPKLS